MPVDASSPSLAASSAAVAPGAGSVIASAIPLDMTGAPVQVGASLLTLASGADGSSQMALSLHPKDLGDVHIQLVRDANGAVQVVVAASEPATLRSLIADQAHLHAALDAAAVPAVDRHVSFELAAPSTFSDGRSAERHPGNPGSPDSGGAMDMSGQDRGGRSGDGQLRRPGEQGMAVTADSRFEQPSQVPPTTTLLLRHGSINITA